MSAREPLARRTHKAIWLSQPVVRAIRPRQGHSTLTVVAALIIGLLIGLGV